MGFLYHGFFQQPTEATLGEATTPQAQGVLHVCWGPHDARVPGSLQSRVWNTGSVEGMFSTRALKCDARFSHGRFHYPHFTDEETKVEIVKRLNRTVQVRPKSSSIPSSVQPKIEKQSATHQAGRLACPRLLFVAKGSQSGSAEASGHWEQRASPHSSASV